MIGRIPGIRYSWKTIGLIMLCATCAACTGNARAADAKVFRAGAFAMEITPPRFPISMNGGMTDRFAKGAFDPLHARCLVLDDGTNKLAIVVCDVCAAPRDVIEDAKRQAAALTKIPASHMLISATHTHTAPTVTSAFQSDPDKDYQKYFATRIAEGIQQANTQLAPARIGWGSGNNPKQLFNRRWKMKPGSIAPSPLGEVDNVRMNPGFGDPNLVEPAGPVDPEVSILAVQALDGRPMALLANYSLHYVGAGIPAELVSADYFAAFAERIGQLIGAGKTEPAFVGIMSNGTSGDVNNNDYSQKSPPAIPPEGKIKLVADSVAQTAYVAYQQIKFHDWVPLAAREKDIELGVRLPSEKDLARAQGILDAAPKRPDGKGPLLTTMPQAYAREQVLLASYPKQVVAKMQAMRIGELGIVAIPCEVFTQIGLDLKQKSPLKPTFTIELANGYNGYLPTPEQHKLGGYETWRARSSYLEVDAATKIIDTCLQLLKDVAK